MGEAVQLQRVFSYEGRQVRMVIRDGEPWWVAKDVCDILGLGNSRMALERLEADEKGVSLIDTPGGPQQVQVVNEPGLYVLILASRKPEAKAFKRWVTHEVLPSIRETGGYNVQELTPIEALLRAVQLMAEQERQIKALQAEHDETKKQVVALTHRVDNLDALDTIGDLRQRLRAMINKYAYQQGIRHERAWEEFTQAFNIAYRTNLKLLMFNYQQKHGIKKMTMPEYLEAAGRLEDAIRVADKMLNREVAV